MGFFASAFLGLLTLTAVNALQQSNRESNGEDDKGDWWPFNIFGGGGDSKGTFKQKLENKGDAEYFGVIEVGGQKLKAIIDTGSFELLVFGANCTLCGSAKDLYNSSKSQSSSSVDFENVHSFGSGTTYSKQARDTVKIGGISIPNQSFWEVYDADMFILSEGAFQAIFGVGPPASAVHFAEDDDTQVHEEVNEMKKSGDKVTKETKDVVQHYDDIVDYMHNVTSVSENLNFSNMSTCLGQRSGSPGYFIWDDHETQTSPEKFAQMDVVGDVYWSASLGQVHLAGATTRGTHASKALKKLAEGSIELGCSKGNCSAIVDTGTSLLVAPTAVVDAIYDLADEWEAAGGSCDDLSQLPELRFTLNGIQFSLPPEAYMGEVDGNVYDDLSKYMPRFFNKQRRRQRFAKQFPEDSYNADISMCEPLVMTLDADSQFGELWILGMPFFRKYYTTFHFTHRDGQILEAAKMSFSEQDGDCKPGSPPQLAHKEKHGRTSTVERLPAEIGEPVSRAQRKAQLKVDAKSIIVPNFIRNAERQAKLRNLMRPFLHL